MRRNFRRKPDGDYGKHNNRNHGTDWNAIPKVRLINEDGTVVGIIPTREALDMANRAGLALINVSPKAVPPVCKICNYGKYVYAQQKKQKNNKVSKFKEVQFSICIEEHDLDIKLRKVVDFLQKKYTVQLVMLLKKRDMARLDDAMSCMQEICKRLKTLAKQIDEPKLTGRKIIALCK